MQTRPLPSSEPTIVPVKGCTPAGINGDPPNPEPPPVPLEVNGGRRSPSYGGHGTAWDSMGWIGWSRKTLRNEGVGESTYGGGRSSHSVSRNKAKTVMSRGQNGLGLVNAALTNCSIFVLAINRNGWYHSG